MKTFRNSSNWNSIPYHTRNSLKNIHKLIYSHLTAWFVCWKISRKNEANDIELRAKSMQTLHISHLSWSLIVIRFQANQQLAINAYWIESFQTEIQTYNESFDDNFFFFCCNII